MYFDCQMSSVEDREQKCIGASKCSLLLSLLSRCVCLDLVPDVMNRMCRRRTASIYFPSLLLVRTCPRLASSKVAPPQSKYGSVASFYTYLPLEACCFFLLVLVLLRTRRAPPPKSVATSHLFPSALAFRQSPRLSPVFSNGRGVPLAFFRGMFLTPPGTGAV